jgi:hypothetical protein
MAIVRTQNVGNSHCHKNVCMNVFRLALKKHNLLEKTVTVKLIF